MGTGAYVKIANASSQTIEVGYWGFNCMYENGTDGSDFGPITATIPPGIPPGTSLPKAGTQYIEANGSDGCAFAPSTFNMNFNVYNPDKESATFYFLEGGSPETSFSVDGENFASKSAGGVTFVVVIGSNNPLPGGQNIISVLAY